MVHGYATITEPHDVLATTQRDLFRTETLPAYDVPINGNDLQRSLAGEPEPTPAWVLPLHGFHLYDQKGGRAL
jgi:hypothetical protein